MTIMRNPPEKLFFYALAAYLLAIGLTIFNIICSYFYFKTVAPGGGWIGDVIAISVSLLMNIVESGTVMVFLSADEAGHLFTPPRIPAPGLPAFVPKLVKFGILGVFGLVLAWTYQIDLQSTRAFLGASGSVGWFIVCACVFGSEFLMVLGHTLWALSKYGKANTRGMWRELNDRLKSGLNSVPIARPPASAQRGASPRQASAPQASAPQASAPQASAPQSLEEIARRRAG